MLDTESQTRILETATMVHEEVELTLPNNKLPDVWNDENRMNVLFAPFRNKSVNPHDWDSKLTFWKKLICDSCTHSKIYSFKLENLQKLFNINGRSPRGLDIVLGEMLKNGDIQPFEIFIQKPTHGWGSWVADVFIKKPIVWSYNKIKDALIPSTIDNTCTYVHVEAIKLESHNLLASLPDELRKRIVSLKELLDAMELKLFKANDTKLILHYLMCTGQVDIHQIKTEQESDANPTNYLIKFRNTKTLEPFTDIDISAHILEQTEKTLLADIEKLEQQMLNYVEEAKGYLSKNHRQMAKNCLKKKHEIDKRVSQKANTLHNIQILLHKLEDTDTNTQVLDTYREALSTLKRNFKEHGLSEESVSQTVTELGDILDTHEEIQNTLSQSLSGDELDLEEELKELIELDNLPPPDSSSPTGPTIDAKADELEQRFQRLKLPNVPSEPLNVKHKISL
ncbi:hypothetical protein FQA39_LY00855 [Lamprigera yunnana]|nr:hypothetical protein FQA39_LY00855 [Lamprigera yunnana]